jgi:hypothetical protein
VLVDQVQRRHDYVRTSGAPGGGGGKWGSGGYNAAQAVGIRTSVSEGAPSPEPTTDDTRNNKQTRTRPAAGDSAAGARCPRGYFGAAEVAGQTRRVAFVKILYNLASDGSGEVDSECADICSSCYQ